MRIRRLSALLPIALQIVMALGLAAQAQPTVPDTHEKLISTLWVQTSQEWRAAALQAFTMARAALDAGLKNRKQSAALEQSGRYGRLPPAVILDVDETVLDNVPGQARQVLARSDFDLAMWNQWVSEAKAAAIPGAVEFCKYAASRNVAVFYISNRDAGIEAATRENLEKLGFPIGGTEDRLLLRGEKPEWTSEKSVRRADVAQRYRVVLLVGDDLGDFLAGARTTVARRQALTRPHEHRWGKLWIMVPNPGYGSWEEALYGSPRPTEAAERLKRKLEALRPER
jgi:acid phosphatase